MTLWEEIMLFLWRTNWNKSGELFPFHTFIFPEKDDDQLKNQS